MAHPILGTPQAPSNELSLAKQVFPRGTALWDETVNTITPTRRELLVVAGKPGISKMLHSVYVSVCVRELHVYVVWSKSIEFEPLNLFNS